nr:hypothetical protein [Pedobacter sp. ASV2]
MEIINRLLESTFTYKVLKKHNFLIKFLATITIPSLLIMTFLAVLFLLFNKYFYTISFVFSAFILTLISIKIQAVENIRIVSNDNNLKSFIESKYGKKRINMTKFNLTMREEIISKIENSDHKISLILLDYLIQDLVENYNIILKRYLIFGVVFSFLFTPFLGIYAQNVNLFAAHLQVSLLVQMSIAIGLIFTAVLVVGFKDIYLFLTKDYDARMTLLSHLKNIKIYILQNPDTQA